MKIKITAFTLLVISLFLLLTSCTKEELNSGIYSTITIGPLNPVEREGKENTLPYQATVTIKMKLLWQLNYLRGHLKIKLVLLYTQMSLWKLIKNPI